MCYRMACTVQKLKNNLFHCYHNRTMTIYSSLKDITPRYKETVITTKKRISWFEKMPGFSCEVQTKAIAEYLGTFKAYQMNKHGNAKITKQ